MVNLEARQYQDKQQQWHTSYKVGKMNPTTGCGLLNNNVNGDCIFGQFARQPFISMKNGPQGQFKSINASVFWFNSPQDGSIQLNQYGNVEMSFPEGLAPLLEAQDWTGRFFIVTLEPITLKDGKAGCKFKLLETDQNGQPLPNQPIPQMPQIPQNRTVTPQYYPGHAPVSAMQQTYQPPRQVPPIGQARMTGQDFAQARQIFGTNPGNIHPEAVRQLQQQEQWPQNAPQVPQNQSYQVPQQNVYPNTPRPPMPNMNSQAPMSAARQVAMQQNPQTPPQVRYNGVQTQNYVPQPIQPVTTMPPLPNTNPNVQQPSNMVNQAQSGNSIPATPQPQMQQQQTQSPLDKYSKFGLDANEVEVLESLLNDVRFNDWKASANREQQYFNEAIDVVAHNIQREIKVERLPVLWECWNSL
jgi:hypothetical protein